MLMLCVRIVKGASLVHVLRAMKETESLIAKVYYNTGNTIADIQ